MDLASLPAEVLQQVLRGTDQDTKTSGLFLASKGLYAASRDPQLWRAVRLGCHGLGATSLAFMGTVATACEELCIANPCPDDVGIFLEDLARLHPAVANGISKLEIVIDGRCSRVPGYMLDAAATGFPALRAMSIHLDGGVEDPDNDITFPENSRLQALETLEIIEMPEYDDEYDEVMAANLCVNFAPACGALPALRRVTMSVASSDILTIATRLPALKAVGYTSELEEYEDACLEGLSLDYLGLTVHEDSDLPALLRALADMEFIGTLSIKAMTDLVFDIGVPVRSLCIHIIEAGAVCQFDYFTIKDEFLTLKRLAVRCSAMPFEAEAVVKFVAVPSVREWLKMHGDYNFHICHRARLELTPGMT